MICKQTQSVIDPVASFINKIANTRIFEPVSLLVVVILYLSQLIFECKLSGPFQYGRTYLLKNLIMNNLNFDKLRFIGPTVYQYGDIESVKVETDVKVMIDIKNSASPD